MVHSTHLNLTLHAKGQPTTTRDYTVISSSQVATEDSQKNQTLAVVSFELTVGVGPEIRA
jgi:hypothetical protein